LILVNARDQEIDRIRVEQILLEVPGAFGVHELEFEAVYEIVEKFCARAGQDLKVVQVVYHSG
jgi:hypothetical protein